MQCALQASKHIALVAEKKLESLQTKEKLDNVERELEKVKTELSSIVKAYDDALSMWKNKWTTLSSTSPMLEETVSIKPQMSAIVLKEALPKPKPKSKTPGKFEKYLPLLAAGAQIRTRRLEWPKNEEKDVELIEQGHKASHYGMALADALVFEPSSPVKYTNKSAFVEMYGVLPNFVIQHRECSKLMDILDWRGTIKDIMAYRYTSDNYEDSTFGVQFYFFLQEHKARTSAGMQKFLDTEEGKTLYELLRKEHEIVMARHKVYLESKKYR
jgi:hypothetical protein